MARDQFGYDAADYDAEDLSYDDDPEPAPTAAELAEDRWRAPLIQSTPDVWGVNRAHAAAATARPAA